MAVRTDTGNPLKRNLIVPQAYPVKIDSNGHVAIGIRYFFASEEERNRVADASMILVECFVAFDKKKNVFGVMGQIDKKENEVKAYIFKADYMRNIADLTH